jgi:type III secretory pathway lipoprotein EscJ
MELVDFSVLIHLKKYDQDDGPRYGSLKVETDHLTEAWLRANGAPVSEDAKVIELFDFF